MKTRICRLGLFAMIVLGLALSPLEARSGARDHDGGFFLRLSAGGGPASTSIEILGVETEFSGTGGDVNFAIGGMVTRNLALHGTIFGWALSEPEMQVGSVDWGEVNADLSMSAVGAGLTYYFMPVNLYLSGSVGAGKLTLDTNVGDFDTDYGIAFDATAGKEWWVSDRWALGVAVGLGLHSIPEEDINEDWSGTNFGIRFTATMN